MPLRYKGTINSRQAANPLVKLVEGKERWKVLTTPGVFSLKIAANQSQIALPHVQCSKLLLTIDLNPAPYRDEFRRR
ncbi:hypothetical protein TNCV_2332521 [Trichonephila clavipes]|nr:hypothetical protein TNCV_2332521 [Trichonephila clavipes]